MVQSLQVVTKDAGNVYIRVSVEEDSFRRQISKAGTLGIFWILTETDQGHEQANHRDEDDPIFCDLFRESTYALGMKKTRAYNPATTLPVFDGVQRRTDLFGWSEPD